MSARTMTGKGLKSGAGLALGCVVLMLMLAGCGGSEVQEVQAWMAEVKATTKAKVEPISAPKDFIPYAYGESAIVDPFSPGRLAGELARVDKASGAFKPDMERPKELLENYPLDTIKMVGLIQKGGVVYALVQVERSVYQVKTGQHLGQNYGVITGVGQDALNLKEIVQDAAGDWVERMAKLELQDSQGSKQ